MATSAWVASAETTSARETLAMEESRGAVPGPTAAPGEVHEAARRAATWGWSVVPVDPDEAAPLVDVEAATHHRATTDELDRWWARWPAARAGVVAGMLSGVLVVEVDLLAGGDGTLAHLESQFAHLPPTVEARLAGHVRQVWFRHDGPRLAGGPVEAGLEVRADGDLVVLPPSAGGEGEPGRRYEWAGEVAPGGHLPPPPDWLLDLARHPHVDRPPVVEQLHLAIEPDPLLTAPAGPQAHHTTTLPPGPAVSVVGESRHQRELLELVGGRRPHGVDRAVTAELVPFDGDPRDRHALGVLVHGLEVGRVVGVDAERCRPAVVAALGRYGVASCAARIRGGWDHGRHDRGRLGITLYLTPELPPDA